MARFTKLRDAIAEHVHDGDMVALEGFTHLIPFAAGHEIIRQHRKNLTLVRMTPDIIYDQLIGMGCATKLIFSWAGNPGAGSLHRFRDAVENSYPHAIEIEEHSHAGMATGYQAGASGLPFGVLRGYAGTDLASITPTIKWVTCPFTNETLAAVPALRPDVAIICAQQADRDGNVTLWGITGVQKEAVLSSKYSIVLVEEVVDAFLPHTNGVVLPSWVVGDVVVVPRGSYPSYAQGYSDRANNFYAYWELISHDRDQFSTWMDEHVLGTSDHGEFLSSLEPSLLGTIDV
ncbi:MAG TPA: CoA-transferase [Acidimicrobiales bacterium]